MTRARKLLTTAANGPKISAFYTSRADLQDFYGHGKRLARLLEGSASVIAEVIVSAQESSLKSLTFILRSGSVFSMTQEEVGRQISLDERCPSCLRVSVYNDDLRQALCAPCGWRHRRPSELFMILKTNDPHASEKCGELLREVLEGECSPLEFVLTLQLFRETFELLATAALRQREEWAGAVRTRISAKKV